MLEIVNNKNDSGSGCDFPQRMVKLETETIIKIVDLTKEYALNPFEVIKIFGAQLIQAGADMQAQHEVRKDNKGGNK